MNHSNLHKSLAVGTDTRKGSKLNKLTRIAAVLQKTNAVSDDVIMVLRLFLVDRDRDIRGHAARVLKYITRNVETFVRVCDTNIPFFMSRCLERNGSKYLMERVQCIKWIYQILKLMKMENNYNRNQGNNHKQFKIEFPCCLTQSLIGIALSPHDELREICLNTLGDLAIENIEVVLKYNGINLMIDCIFDTSFSKQASQSLFCKILHILDDPNGRKHLKQRSNIEQLFAPFMHMLQFENKKQREDVAIQVSYCFFKKKTGDIAFFFFIFCCFVYNYFVVIFWWCKNIGILWL